MASFKAECQRKEWRRGEFLISTNAALIPLQKIQDVFASDEIYWTKAPPLGLVQQLLENSLPFAIYHLRDQPGHTPSQDHSQTPTPRELDPASMQLVGLGRCITDYTTLMYLTDVWVEESYRGQGLGKWLIGCIREVIDSMPFLRGTMLITSDWQRSVPFYRQLLGVEAMAFTDGEGAVVMRSSGPGRDP